MIANPPWAWHPELLATPVPRYTSFPTAAEFVEGVGEAELDEAIGALVPGTDVSLYVHIPYCREICWYCGCNTGAANRAGRLQAYVQRLGQEIDDLARRLDGRGTIGRLAWGGGSPNALSPDQFRALTARIKAAFGSDEPVTSIELDPRTLDADWIECIGELLHARVSLGVQTFSPHIQQAIGRIQPREMIEAIVGQLRAQRVESINFDLMYGLPDQSEADLRETIEGALALHPDRLAVFGYAHVPQMLPRQRLIDANALPGVEQRFSQAEMAQAMLLEAGYVAIGFDHFALPSDAIAVAARNGRLRRNFQGFTEDQAEVLLGLGASAIGMFPGALLQNEKNAGRYQMRVAARGTAVARGRIRTADDRIRAQCIEQLLCQGAADLAALPDISAVTDRLTAHAAYGLIRWEGTRLTIAPAAVPYARSIAAALDPYRHPAGRQFSSAV